MSKRPAKKSKHSSSQEVDLSHLLGKVRILEAQVGSLRYDLVMSLRSLARQQPGAGENKDLPPQDILALEIVEGDVELVDRPVNPSREMIQVINDTDENVSVINGVLTWDMPGTLKINVPDGEDRGIKKSNRNTVIRTEFVHYVYYDPCDPRNWPDGIVPEGIACITQLNRHVVVQAEDVGGNSGNNASVNQIVLGRNRNGGFSLTVRP